MRTLARTLALGLLVMLQQVLLPTPAPAQVDPCTPVPIPELCETADLIEPSPSPSPSPSDGGGGKGGNGGKGGHGGKGGGGGGGGGGNASGDGKNGKNGKNGKGDKADDAELEVPLKPPKPTGPFAVSSPNNSQRLVEILTLMERYGTTLQQALFQSVGPFPVAGLAYWTDDWHACRDGCTRFHEGLDIFAREGTPLVATADGVVTQKLVGELSGISLEIEDAQGIQYFYAHLSAWAEPIKVGDQVQVGQVIGYLGHTGNAMFTPPHLHLEIQPGGVPVPPKPFVDRWLKIAELRAEQIVADATGAPAPETSDFRITRLFNLSGGSEILDAGADRVLALAGIQPNVSSLEVARQLLGQMAYEIDWAGQADPELAALVEEVALAADGHDLAGATPWSPFGTTTAATDGAPSVPEQGD